MGLDCVGLGVGGWITGNKGVRGIWGIGTLAEGKERLIL